MFKLSAGTFHNEGDNEILIIGDIPIRLIRSKRRTLELQVRSTGVVMRIPMRCSSASIMEFAQLRHHWLQQKTQLLEQKLVQAEKQFIDGESFNYLGKAFTLRLRLHDNRKNDFSNNELSLSVPKKVKNQTQYVRKKLINWYKENALADVTHTTQIYAQQMELTYNSIKIRDYKARWGSCSAKGELSFNWRIIMAPRPAFDYVIVHELAHLQHFNHSPHFWQLVKHSMPDYLRQKQWFRDNRHELMF